MGKVYLARNGEQVALKVLHPHLLESPEALERFRREAQIGRRVEHANIVRTLDVGSAVVNGVTQHYLAPAESVETLATYRTEIAKRGAPKGVMPGTAAMASARYGKGRVFVISPHPEKTRGLGGMVRSAIVWAGR